MEHAPGSTITRLTAICEQTPGILFSLTIEKQDQFRFFSVSDLFLSTIGLAKEQVIGKLAQEVIPAPSIDVVLAHYKNAVRTRKPVKWFESTRYPTGLKHGEVCVSPVFNESNDVSMLLGIVIDITERKEAETEKEQFYTFFQTSADLMCIADPRGKFLKTNPAFTETLGYSEAELIAKPFLDFVHPEDRQSTEKEMAKQLEKGFSFNFENRYVCKDGSVRWLSWRARYVATDDLTFATARDITENRLFEARLVEAKQLAESAVRTKAAFLDIAAHELRTPITAISALLELAQRLTERGQSPSPDLLNKLRRPTEHLSRLVVELLDVARLERGLLVLRPVKTDLAALISTCLDEYRIMAPKSDFRFARPNSPVEAELDHLRITQVLSNLLDNTLRYSPEEFPIEIKLEASPESVRIAVIDQGPGIPDAQLKTLFSSFSRGHSEATLRTRGLGIGLFVCKTIVEMSGGRIQVTSKQGQGSTFSFELPRGQNLRRST